MSDMPSTAIANFMQRDFVVVREKASGVKPAVQMTKQRIGCLVVYDESGDSEHQPIVGLVSETDLVRKVLESDPLDLSTPVGQFMWNELQLVSANRSILEASDLMAEKWIRHLPVTENDSNVGILYAQDLIIMVALGDRPRFLRQK